jgi:zinc protease
LSRDDLYGYYRRHYVPNTATLVIAGDVDVAEVIRSVDRRFGSLQPREIERGVRVREPLQLGERRVRISREGTTAYLKVACHAPAAAESDFCAMLLLDAVLTGAKGINLWASYRTPPPQRSARLYQSLVNTGLASAVSGGLVPTAEPFLYTLSATATDGTSLSAVEEALLAELARVRSAGVTPEELRRAKNQLRARVIFENDSISNIAHQLGYFETIATWGTYTSLPAQIERVTLEDVGAAAVARLGPAGRTVGCFEPLPPGSSDPADRLEGAGSGPVTR